MLSAIGVGICAKTYVWCGIEWNVGASKLSSRMLRILFQVVFMYLGIFMNIYIYISYQLSKNEDTNLKECNEGVYGKLWKEETEGGNYPITIISRSKWLKKYS